MPPTVDPSSCTTIRFTALNRDQLADDSRSLWSRVTALNVAAFIAAVLSALTITVGFLALDGDRSARPLAAVSAVLTLLAWNAVAVALGREYLDRRSRMIEERLTERFETDLAAGRQIVLQGFNDVRCQVALLRAEIGAQIATLPGRMEQYAEMAVMDCRADAALAAVGACPDPSDGPPNLCLVRESGRRY